MLKRSTITLVAFLFAITLALGQNWKGEELGKVDWLRDYDQAISQAKQEGKAVLILFQEVPGCATCRNYGHNVLSHPLMVEAIENSFVPLAIFNNKGGKDREVLRKFGEPSWNNPVVRIIDTEGKGIVKRIGGDYSALTLCQRMKEALVNQGKEVPEYMSLLEQELAANNGEEAYYQMYCFWTGEKNLGAIEGVVSTESGFMNGHEVVKVTYDAARVDQDLLNQKAAQHNFQVTPKSSFRTSARDKNYYLQLSKYAYLPLTEIQKTKINSALGLKQSAEKLLSPKQKQWLAQLVASNEKTKKLFNLEFAEAWEWMEGQKL